MGLDELQRNLASLFGQSKQGIVDALPNLAAAVLILLLGWWLAWSLRKLVRRLFRGLTARMPPGATRAAWAESVDDRDAGSVAANGVYWLVLLTSLMVAIDALGLPVFSKWSGTLAGYLPKLIIAAGLVFAGVVAGRVARNAILKTGRRLPPSQAHTLARFTHVSIVAASIVVAAGQLGVDVSFLTQAFLLVLAAMLGGAALAFGLGARDVMANILSMHYVRKSYRVGQVVRIGSAQGRIARTTNTTVLLEASEGEISIPGRSFANAECVLLSEEEQHGT